MPFLKGKGKVTHSEYLTNLTKKNGPRRAIFNIIGDRYTGDWKNDFKEGKGILLNHLRQVYEGDFEKNLFHGFGVFAKENENKIFKLSYRGNWLNGKMDGQGLRRYDNGEVYIGSWKNGKRHGYGLMWYCDGNFYAGDFFKDKRQGLGMLVLPNSCRYEGSWFKDLKHGKGKFLHLLTGQMQKGVWNKDICVYSVMVDTCYRQACVYPTPYPICPTELSKMEEVCATRELRALKGSALSCLVEIPVPVRTTSDVRSANV